MSTIVVELYQALRKAGVDEQLARDAAHAVLGSDMKHELATKADVALLKSEVAEFRSDMQAKFAESKADLANTRVELIKWNVGAMAVLTAVFAAISRLG